MQLPPAVPTGSQVTDLRLKGRSIIVSQDMIVAIATKIVIALIYISDFLAMAAPILLWLAIGVYTNLSHAFFFWGWLIVMIFSLSIWLRLIARIKKQLWKRLIDPDSS